MTRLPGYAAAAVFTALGAAHATEVTQSVTTTASPAAVWKIVGDFDGIAGWLPGAVSSPANDGNTPGSIRVITLKAPGNPTVREKLLERTKMSYTYAIMAVDPKVLPVTGYTSTITVAPAAGGSTVTWHADFQPAGGADDAGASKAVTGLYQAGLGNIKSMAEK